MLDDVATALEHLVRDVLHLMNEGARLDHIVHTVRVPAELLAKPYLRPTYDEPEYVVRNIWRLYGGWWDGDPSTLKPAPATRLAQEVVELAGAEAAESAGREEGRVGLCNVSVVLEIVRHDDERPVFF